MGVAHSKALRGKPANHIGVRQSGDGLLQERLLATEERYGAPFG